LTISWFSAARNRYREFTQCDCTSSGWHQGGWRQSAIRGRGRRASRASDDDVARPFARGRCWQRRDVSHQLRCRHFSDVDTRLRGCLIVQCCWLYRTNHSNDSTYTCWPMPTHGAMQSRRKPRRRPEAPDRGGGPITG